MNILSYSPSIFLLRNTFNRSFHISAINYALPTKAKKKADPMTDKIREDRKRRRYEKVIDKLEKFKLQLKPIHEYESERRILKELDVRKRSTVELTSEETTRRLMLNRDWAKHKHRQHQQEITLMSRAFKSQEDALEQLKLESEELYDKALQVDSKLIPFIRRGPLYSLPNSNYDAPDGDYFDTTNYFTKGFGVNFMDHMKTMERQKWTEIRAERRAKKEEKADDK
ncbi:unnamed protein product [Rotaria socialis]|uniref:Large ribosomal subunit protein mL40 n=1 Tax=Rotaria socialis TaxID=392032 RepID=A0A818PV56_9BILA|nr:unnamed protein product [Rotaria socialis]CAF3351343.1 unnamed protein product [Rotaria socialis]CAF3374234.1 unnamed protein product [Rotaria socialis]CAF3412227.1 unnamed protein product [Rotaria socialis]CAF3626626.1 unnamed protein product [Rotaria socialis]